MDQGMALGRRSDNEAMASGAQEGYADYLLLSKCKKMKSTSECPRKGEVSEGTFW
jgi:hypothetical protein